MPKTQISKNGDLLRIVSDWFDENLESAKRKFRKTKLDRAAKITEKQDESKWDAVKYYFKQLHNANKAGFSALFEYITKLANVGLIDNAILRKAEKAYVELKQSDKKFVEWLRHHPSISSYLSYYFIIAALSLSTWGAAKASNDKNKDDKEGEKQEIVIEPNENDIIEPEEDEDKWEKYTSVSKVYDINDENFITKFVDENWGDIVIGLLEFETYRPTPKLHKGESRYTYGPGLTWVYIKDKNGKIVKKPCSGEYKRMADKFTPKQIWNQVRIHITRESVPVVKKALLNKGITRTTTEQIIGLVLASYQLPAHTQEIVNGISDAGNNTQKQIDAFQYYSGNSKWKEGTLKRRWWCAMYYAGKITSNDLLELNRDVFSGANINILLVKKHFVMDKATIRYALGLSNNKSTVREFIEQDNLFALGNKKTKPQENMTPEENEENPSMAEMIAGLNAFKSSKYDVAISHYEKAISLNADNMEAYSSLSFTYKKLGDNYMKAQDFQKAKVCYENAIAAVKQGRDRMNANKDLLLDREIKARLYYNAGQARDRLADIYMAQNNIVAAINEYDLAAKNYQTAIANAKEIEAEESIIQIYKDAKANSKSNKQQLEQKQNAQKAARKNNAVLKSATSKVKSNKKQSFANATMKIKNGRTLYAPRLFVQREKTV